MREHLRLCGARRIRGELRRRLLLRLLVHRPYQGRLHERAIASAAAKGYKTLTRHGCGL